MLYLVVMLFIAWIDVMVGKQINLWILYGIPIGLATWRLGMLPGLLLATVGVFLLLATSVIWGYLHDSFVLLVVSCASKAIAYYILVKLVGALRKREIERVFMPLNH